MRIAWIVLAIAGCSEPEAPADLPIVAGPFAGDLQMTDHTHEALPRAEETVGPADTVRFYWFHPQAAGKSIAWTVRAEAAEALGHGSVVHEEAERVSGRQGMVSFHPSQLSRGGARRTADGALHWPAGLYSVTGTLEGHGAPLGRGLFEVR